MAGSFSAPDKRMSISKRDVSREVESVSDVAVDMGDGEVAFTSDRRVVVFDGIYFEIFWLVSLATGQFCSRATHNNSSSSSCQSSMLLSGLAFACCRDSFAVPIPSLWASF